ncbi:MAG: translation initiation factor IF-2 [Candidatus Niyogibacteria bacterium]|nr:translation initiation factor IF-2 [Candidatus Niyogibacteria bacterium]
MKNNPPSPVVSVRAPIVVVMGHIDHGKTTLLDSIRRSNVAERESGPPSVAEGEAGGITQHIGAYEVAVSAKDGAAKKITFIDTPGHAAFSQMRSRGARVADIAILVVAADDGVKPQTKEALDAIRAADIPFIVALNKIDKPDANPEKTKKELSENGVFVEEWGGKIPLIALSARTGTGVQELLEMILLVSELEDLKTDLSSPASGVVIEAHQDPKRGNAATAILLSGTLRSGEFVAGGPVWAPVRIFEDFAGHAIREAGAGQAVRIVGFSALPAVGSTLAAFASKKEAGASASDVREKTTREAMMARSAENVVEIPVVIKADVSGSLEALEAEIRNFEKPRLKIRFLKKGVGALNEDDIKTASGSPRTIVVAFRVAIEKSARDLAERFSISVQAFDIIYDASDWLRQEIEKRIPSETVEKIVGRAKILKLFKAEGDKQVFGGRVLEGAVLAGKKFRIVRRAHTLGEGKILELQQQKSRVSAVEEGKEFGILAASKISVAEGDEIEVIDYEEIRKTLE